MFTFQTLSNTYKSESLSLLSFLPCLLRQFSVWSQHLSMRFLLPPAFHAIYFVSTRRPFQAGRIYSCLMSREIWPSRVTTLTFDVLLRPQVPPRREYTGPPPAPPGLSPTSPCSSSSPSSFRGDSTELLWLGVELSTNTSCCKTCTM